MRIRGDNLECGQDGFCNPGKYNAGNIQSAENCENRNLDTRHGFRTEIADVFSDTGDNFCDPEDG